MLNLSLVPDAKEQKLPPVHLWNPNFCGDMDMVIKANGDWIHEGRPITRPAMIKLFSRILWLEDEQYFLKSPVEKVRIQVEDAPFLVKKYDTVTHEDGLNYFEFTTTADDKLILGKNVDSLWVDVLNDQTRPYVSVRYGMKALLSRQVFYDLVEHGETHQIDGQSHHCIQSGGVFFSLGKLEEE